MANSTLFLKSVINNKSRAFNLVLICALLVIAIIVVYWQVINFDFVSFDDPFYVKDNSVVGNGITLHGIRWAFTTTYFANWHPLTWISHMLDVQFFGMTPGFHHFTNVLIHALNTILLFIIFHKMTGAVWRSAAVAALFALHPLHIESVAWISERKDVLSTFFWMLTMMGYLWYINHRNIRRYLVVVTFYILGLMSKPMLVTLPFVLLLLDFWPLHRLDLIQTGDNDNNDVKVMGESSGRWSRLPSLILEKIPLIILVTISCGITIYAQWGAVGSFEALPIGTRIANAIISYVAYLWKMLWPLNLAAFYPYPGFFNPPKVVLCAIFLLIISALVIYNARKSPYLLVGWLWYIGTLLPVIGIVQVGSQSMADRYTYIPLIGIFLSLVWGLWELFCRLRYGKITLVVVFVSALIFFTVITQIQVGFWKNSETLYRHALEVTENNCVAHNGLGLVLSDKGDIEGAISEYNKAMLMNPMFYQALFNLGRAYKEEREPIMAIEYYLEGLQINPNLPSDHNDLGDLFVMTGQTDEAIKQYGESLRLDPYQPVVYNNLGNTYIHKADLKKAADCFKAAILINPDYVEAHRSLDNVQIAQSKIEGSISMLKQELEAQPRNQALYEQLADLHRQLGELDEATFLYQKALSIKPDYTKALYGLALIYSTRQEYAKALDMLQGIRQFQPGNPEVYYKIACIYAKQKKVNESISWLKQAIDKGFNNWDQIKKDPDLASIRNTVFINELIKNH